MLGLKYPVALIATLGALFGGQSLAIRSLHGGALKSESNYFSSLARIQAGTAGNPAVMFLGSSLTGRLPDRRGGLAAVANLGCDGGSALEVLEAMDRRELTPAPCVVVEGNTFYRALAGRSPLAKAMAGRWFRLGSRVPQLGAVGRPSGFVYSALMDWRFGSGNAADGGSRRAAGGPTPPPPVELTTPAEQDLVKQVAGLLRRLAAAGTRVIVVLLPPGAAADTVNFRLAAGTAAAAEVGWWDLTREFEPGEIRFTDHVHMDRASALTVTRMILGELGQSQPRSAPPAVRSRP